jgi:hypothetical protein
MILVLQVSRISAEIDILLLRIENLHRVAQRKALISPNRRPQQLPGQF